MCSRQELDPSTPLPPSITQKYWVGDPVYLPPKADMSVKSANMYYLYMLKYIVFI